MACSSTSRFRSRWLPSGGGCRRTSSRLESSLGEGGIERLLGEFAGQREAMLSHARTMFEAWLELAAPVAR